MTVNTFMSFPINNSGKNGGIIKGKNISQLLHQLTEGYQNVTNFDSLQFLLHVLPQIW